MFARDILNDEGRVRAWAGVVLVERSAGGEPPCAQDR